ncbi:MAG TPA: hypothetical protein VH413_00285 [Verrucomicrobiae bacterium]|jgi:hypothetical protein|nr:hypothetical protein [Verrucomicrobiae bacterium]
MILSADELEVLDYLKSWKGTSVPLAEISRCAGGRRKFREKPDWARGLMTRLVEAKLVTVNDRGHFRFVEVEDADVNAKSKLPPPPKKCFQVDDNYFPADIQLPMADSVDGIVGEDYFPVPPQDISMKRSEDWFSAQIREILEETGLPFGPLAAEE